MGVGEELTPSHRTQWTEWWSSLLLNSLSQPGQHPPQSGDGPGPRETNSPRDCQQQRTPAHAEHQRRFPVPQNTPAPHGRRETQQGAKKTTCKHWHIEEGWFEFSFCFSNSFVRTSSYLSVHYSHLFLFFHQAAILQQTADYIFALEQEKTQLLAQNNQLKRFIQVTACAMFYIRTVSNPVYIAIVCITLPITHF